MLTFPVRLMNTSKRPIWYYENFGTRPSYRLQMRQRRAGQWIDYSYIVAMCGMGAQVMKIEPGDSVRFELSAFPDLGKEVRFEVNILKTPYGSGESIPIRSRATRVK